MYMYIRKIILWNVRGVNDSKKRGIIKGCLRRWKSDVICLQETKMNDINNRVISGLWSDKKVDWIFLLADGSAKGILITWDKEKFCCKGVERGRVSLSVLLEICGSGED